MRFALHTFLCGALLLTGCARGGTVPLSHSPTSPPDDLEAKQQRIINEADEYVANLGTGGSGLDGGTSHATGCTPDRSEGKIHRSRAAVDHFKATHVCPSTGKAGPHSCPGYVVDHLWPLCAGGCDTPENMAYEPLEESHRKDQLEWRICREAEPEDLP